MATPDEVRASLLASGDHGRDGCARRKLADEVRRVTLLGVVNALEAAPTFENGPDAAEVATAASAVVLASDLRAPAETRAEFLRRLADDVKAGNVTMVNAGDSPFRVPSGSPNRQGWRAMAKIVAARNWLKGAPESYHVDQAGLCLDDLADALQGWRARLASVERLLAASLDSKTPRQAAETVADALAEVRAMIDGEDE